MTTNPRKRLVLLVSAAMIGGSLGALAPGATALADSAPLDPSNPATPTTVTADPLPTVQVDGVVWSQVVVGNTVYVGGKFTTARPAGAAPGVSTTTRNNLLAYDIRTGALITSFAPDLNAQALAVAASPDGSRLYVGGDFTRANGQVRNRVAAYDTATGALVAGFAPSPSSQVRAIAATAGTVYLGGAFGTVGSAARPRLAAVSAANGSLLPWSPVPGTGPTSGNSNGNTATSNVVHAVVVTGGGSQVIVGGRFDTLNGTRSTGVGALDPVTGATRPFAVGQQVTNQGANSAVWSLTADATSVYGTGYDYYGPGNLEGSFSAAVDGGALRWMNDCHGDTYSSYPLRGALYMATHAHDCGNIGGFPEENPRINKFATAVSLAATGTVGSSTLANGNFRGAPAPTLLPWFPVLGIGSVTGQNQAGWSVTGNNDYVVFGGEFPRAGGVAQQGLVRFAVPALAPKKVAPVAFTAAPTAKALPGGVVNVGWGTTSDVDNENLTYRVFRNGNLTTPVHTSPAIASTFWRKRSVNFVDADHGQPAGSTLSYRIGAYDPDGNRVLSTTVSVTVAGGTPPSAYALSVLRNGATHLWSLDDAPGSGRAADSTGTGDLAVRNGVTPGRAGALAGGAGTAFDFDGREGLAATEATTTGPQVFSLETWIRTTTTRGGKIIGFGDRNSGLSSNYDRHVYLQDDGRVTFGVYPGQERTVSSSQRVNDGSWHHVVATLSGSGMQLYVDGGLAAERLDTTSAQSYTGYWRLGGDRRWAGSSDWFAGTIDEAAVYPTALTAGQVSAQNDLGRSGTPSNQPPTAAFSALTSDLTASFSGTASSDPDGTVSSYAWDFGDGTAGTGATTSRTYAQAGTYTVGLSVTDDDGATATTSRSVTVSAPPPAPNRAPSAAFTSTVSGLTAAYDARSSTDADGTVTAYAWDFGDGTTGADSTVSRTYAQAGTYTARLTVTDDDGATATTTRQVTVAAAAPPPAPQPRLLADDTFARTSSGGLGTADVGGAWSTLAGGTRQSVAPGAATFSLPVAAASVGAHLGGVSSSATDVRATMSLSGQLTSTGTSVYVLGRRVGTNQEYRGRLRFLTNGSVMLGVTRLSGSASEVLVGAEVRMPGTYTAGSDLEVRMQVTGSSPTTVSLTAWPRGSAEPAQPALTRTDATAGLQAAGSVGLSSYLSGSATAPVTLRVTRFTASAL